MQCNSHDGTIGGEDGEGGNQKVDLCRNYLKQNVCCGQAPKQLEQRYQAPKQHEAWRRKLHTFLHAHIKVISTRVGASATAAAP